MHEAQPKVYTHAAMESLDRSLITLERSLVGLRESEQIKFAWAWFERLEKDHPSVAQIVFKSYAESFAPVGSAASKAQSHPSLRAFREDGIGSHTKINPLCRDKANSPFDAAG